MDQEKIGKFILELRKKNELTQSAFASRLNVTAQAVSKWENGRGIPDIEILKKISSEFNVDIDTIINGEEKKKQNKHTKYIVFASICLCAILISMVVIIQTHRDYEFSNIKSTNDEFNIKGVAAYSTDKNSIYISSIEYLKGDEEETYTNMECTLYESHKSIDKKISKWGSLKKNSQQEEKPLSELLQGIEFKVEDYASTCKNLKTSNLYININVKDKNNKITTYKIPLELTGNCN